MNKVYSIWRAVFKKERRLVRIGNRSLENCDEAS